MDESRPVKPNGALGKITGILWTDLMGGVMLCTMHIGIDGLLSYPHTIPDREVLNSSGRYIPYSLNTPSPVSAFPGHEIFVSSMHTTSRT